MITLISSLFSPKTYTNEQTFFRSTNSWSNRIQTKPNCYVNKKQRLFSHAYVYVDIQIEKNVIICRYKAYRKERSERRRPERKLERIEEENGWFGKREMLKFWNGQCAHYYFLLILSFIFFLYILRPNETVV